MPSTRGLVPGFKPWADELLRVARYFDPGFVITSSVRSRAEQEALYARWLAGDSRIFTPAVPGTSPHERGLAIDLARPSVDPQKDEILAALGEAWRSLGGKWPGPKDPVHFQWPFDS